MKPNKQKLNREERAMESAALASMNELDDPTRLDALKRAAMESVEERKRPVNIRLAASDLERLKTKAAALGLGYQTLMGSVLHRFATGDLVDRDLLEQLKAFTTASQPRSARNRPARRVAGRSKKKAG